MCHGRPSVESLEQGCPVLSWRLTILHVVPVSMLQPLIQCLNDLFRFGRSLFLTHGRQCFIEQKHTSAPKSTATEKRIEIYPLQFKIAIIPSSFDCFKIMESLFNNYETNRVRVKLIYLKFVFVLFQFCSHQLHCKVIIELCGQKGGLEVLQTP